MHCSNKRKKDTITVKEIDEWLEYFPWDYDDWCNLNCPCCQPQPSGNEDFFQKIAEHVADLLIKQRILDSTNRDLLIAERMNEYNSWQTRDTKINNKIKEDVAFIWPHIKDTKDGFELFAQIFGDNK